MGYILNLEWIGVLMILFTGFMIINDRAFSKRIRGEYLMAIAVCLILSIMGQHLHMDNIQNKEWVRTGVFYAEAFLRPIVPLMLIMVADVWDDRICIALWIPVIANLIFAALHIWIVSLLVFSAYIVIMIVTLFIVSKKDDISDYIFAAALLVMVAMSITIEQYLKFTDIFNSTLCVITSVYYYYFVIRTYKKDRLTGLLIRHNLNYELADLTRYVYEIALLDVDGFKLINDKYGHNWGDEVLVKIVDTIKERLPKGCRMYRYGGDEFVIVSRNVPREKVITALDAANELLSKESLRFSYGFACHNPGESAEDALKEADQAMYESKRLLKSEDIWDDMTGLFNYRGFQEELDLMRNNAARTNLSVCLIGFDIERLNNLNMAYGYTEGNLVILTLARILKLHLRNRDFSGHLGSDEFAVAMECDTTDQGYVKAFIEQIQNSINSAYELEKKDYTIKLNTAFLFIPKESGISSDEYLNTVLYMKQEGKENRRKNNIGYDETAYSAEDEKAVMDILDHNKLRYAYQPIVSAKDGSIIAYEALMRSDSATMISPLKILNYADRNGRNYEVEKYTFLNVFEDMTVRQLPKDRRIFINSIPGYELNDEDYAYIAGKYGDLLKRCVIEITEQKEMGDMILDVLHHRRSKDGFELAIDDYGSGRSNTNNLLRYMPQIIKLDRLLIAGIDHNAKKQFFVNSILSFARENDMQILAEGVETEQELKMVIRLGVDYIQGYITGKPEYELLQEIEPEIRRMIVDENLRARNNQRMIYTASSNSTLSVIQLAMEDYSKINVSGEYITLNGNEEYTADMVVHIKDGVNCRLKLSNVRLNSVDDEPCITVGEGANLILELEGSNRLNSKGIYVPEGSSLTIVGTGNLEMNVKGLECYAIGCDSEHAFGRLELRGSGIFRINIDGENCIGIGGGIGEGNSEILIQAGYYEINVAGVDAVGVGAFRGEVPITMKDFAGSVNFRVNVGIIIGVKEGKQDINILNFALSVTGSGNSIAAIGSTAETEGRICMNSGTFQIRLNGQLMYLIGSKAGPLKIEIIHIRMDMIGEGDHILAIGSLDRRAWLDLNECTLGLVINASDPVAFGNVNPGGIRLIGQGTDIRINGVVNTDYTHNAEAEGGQDE